MTVQNFEEIHPSKCSATKVLVHSNNSSIDQINFLHTKDADVCHSFSSQPLGIISIE